MDNVKKEACHNYWQASFLAQNVQFLRVFYDIVCKLEFSGL